MEEDKVQDAEAPAGLAQEPQAAVAPPAPAVAPPATRTSATHRSRIVVRCPVCSAAIEV